MAIWTNKIIYNRFGGINSLTCETLEIALQTAKEMHKNNIAQILGIVSEDSLYIPEVKVTNNISRDILQGQAIEMLMTVGVSPFNFNGDLKKLDLDE